MGRTPRVTFRARSTVGPAYSVICAPALRGKVGGMAKDSVRHTINTKLHYNIVFPPAPELICIQALAPLMLVAHPSSARGVGQRSIEDVSQMGRGGEP